MGCLALRSHHLLHGPVLALLGPYPFLALQTVLALSHRASTGNVHWTASHLHSAWFGGFLTLCSVQVQHRVPAVVQMAALEIHSSISIWQPLRTLTCLLSHWTDKPPTHSWEFYINQVFCMAIASNGGDVKKRILWKISHILCCGNFQVCTQVSVKDSFRLSV